VPILTQPRPAPVQQPSGDAPPGPPEAAAAPPGQEAAGQVAAGGAPADTGVPRQTAVPEAEALHEAQAKVPRLSARGRLSPEEEREIEEALQGISLAGDLPATLDAPRVAPLDTEARVRARVAAINRGEVLVEITGKQQGKVGLDQFQHVPEIGSTLELVVTGFDADEQLYRLRLPGGAVEAADWADIYEGAVVSASITGHNKGGLECKVNAIRGFIPASQIAQHRVENLEEWVGRTLPCVVVEAKRERRNLVLSHRAVLEREQREAKERFLAQLAPGQVYEGTVRKIMDFGAFVDIGGVDGLVHVSKLSWSRVNHPSDVLKEGDRVRVRVEKYDPETRKISLSMRDLAANPWDLAPHKYAVGDVVGGRVTRLMDFGAFVELEPGLEGLIHVSEISHQRVRLPRDVLEPGQQVQVKILAVDADKKRVALSMKALESHAVEEAPTAAEEPDPQLESARDALRKQRQKPLRGGIGRGSSGDRFGLKW
jgi:small subunit ribosomal protein S1